MFLFFLFQLSMHGTVKVAFYSMGCPFDLMSGGVKRVHGTRITLPDLHQTSISHLLSCRHVRAMR